MQLGPLGFPELLLLFVVVLIVFGPRRLPDIGRSIGRTVSELRRGAEDLRRAIEKEVDLGDVRRAAGVDGLAQDLRRVTDSLNIPEMSAGPSAVAPTPSVPGADGEPSSPAGSAGEGRAEGTEGETRAPSEDSRVPRGSGEER